jgi:hypothetical protein
LPDAATILLRFPDAVERAHWRGGAAGSVPGAMPAGE